MAPAKNLSRRTLAKTLAAGAASLGIPRWAEGEPLSNEALPVGACTELHPGVWRVRVGTPETYTPVGSRLVPPREDAFASLPSVPQPPRLLITATRSARGCTLRWPLGPNEQIFGLGLQMLSFAQRGSKKMVRVNADPRVDTGDSNAPVPFFVSTAGIGILVDTARYASFYFGDAHLKPTQPAASTSGASVDPQYRNVESPGHQDFVMVDIPVAAGADIYLFAGPGMLNAVRRYNVFSGGGFVPPEWGLGFWFRAMAKDTQADVLSLLQQLRDQKIPCDVIGLEPGWQSHAYSCSFVWDDGRFPDPPRFLAAARAQHLRVNLWEHAFTHPSSPLFPKLVPYSGNFGVWNGLVPDFAGQPARDIFGEFHGKTLIDAGVSGFKLDECDNSDFTHGWSFPECSSFPSGVDGEQMHCVFGLRYQSSIWDAFRKRGLESYGLVRSSGALAAPYPFVLYSDLYDHRQYIRALANSGFSGLLWCPEVRQADSEEDLIRRLESVVFSPLAQVDCWYMKNPPWKQTDRTKNNAGEFLPDWQQLEARCREIIGWRMALVPYLTAAFQRYRQDGTPPFRALVLDWPEDQRLYHVDDQYLVGDRMMVAPLFAGEPERAIIMPQGTWHDFWTGAVIQGNTQITVPSSTKNIPVYVKAGSLVPWADVGQFAGDAPARRLVVRVYGDGSLPFSMQAAHKQLTLRWEGHSGYESSSKTGYEVRQWAVVG